ncbi:macrophage mannose receptor 1-like isoform X1 [Haliotis asinina]|uniref:macrophage mannose receptor 1-like isoform X1 n=1 Tax=Haliotis asinina TaxID=109174 RepID=UPI003531A35A
MESITGLIFFCLIGGAVCSCPSNAVWFEEEVSCYSISNSAKVTWGDARQACEDMGGSLLVINSHTEEDLISDSLRTRLSRNASADSQLQWWIGLSGVNDRWTWVDNTPADTDTLLWHASEPNIQDRKACVVFRQTLLSDVDCQFKKHFICELPPLSPRPEPSVSTPTSDTLSAATKRLLFCGIIGGVALLAVIAIIAVMCLAARVRHLRRTYQKGQHHPDLTSQSSTHTDGVSQRAPQTLPRSEAAAKPTLRFQLTTHHSYAEPEAESHPGYEKLNKFTPRYLELTK